MIGRLEGVVVDRRHDGTCVVDVGGLGYEVCVAIPTLDRLPPPPTPTVLYVHTHVREDTFALYGFGSREDRDAFRTVLGVSGVGPKSALSILSALPARDLAAAIGAQNRTVLKGIPGVGRKTIDRLLLELRDRLSWVGEAGEAERPRATPPKPLPSATGTVVNALVQMGYKPAQADTAVAAIQDAEGRSTEELLREALGHLG